MGSKDHLKPIYEFSDAALNTDFKIFNFEYDNIPESCPITFFRIYIFP